MIRSMTGFGEATGEVEKGTLTVELRTVNHRYLNINTRLPGTMLRLEGEVRDWLKDHFHRGHVNCSVRLEASSEADGGRTYRLDEDKVRNYLQMFARLNNEFGVEGKPDLALISRFSDVIVRAEEDEDLDEDVPTDGLREIVRAAANQVNRMRAEEGRRLLDDLQGRIRAMAAALDSIEEVAPRRLEMERTRLSEAVRELMAGPAPDPDRLAQEIAILAERWDINEELVRFRSHIELFNETVEGEGTEAVGKRLGFLVQEMHREANTIGSKANNAEISHLVVAIKDELERLREQVENVE